MQGTTTNLGSPGSCEAQSFGYGLGAYTAARLPDGSLKWSAGDLANTPSAAFLFTLGIAAGDASCPKGGLALPYLRQLIAFGSASTAQVPYRPSCCYFDEIDENRRWPGAERLRIGSFATFAVSSTQLDLMRDLLAAGHAIAFSGPVLEGYDAPLLRFGVFGSNGGMQPLTKPGSGHGQLVVGYDDTRGDPDAPGAFLIQNSFGTKWPPTSPGGRIWWAYDTFLSTQSLAAVAYSLAAAPPAGSTSLTTAGMPAAHLTAVNHWVDPSAPSDVYLILSLEFSEPVVVESVRVTQPRSSREVQQQFGEPFSNGYVFFRRVDGHQFENGAWPLRIEVTSSDDMPVTYTGLVGVIPSVPTQPSEASATLPIYGSNGNEVMITP